MVNPLCRWPVILLVVIYPPAVSVGQVVESPRVRSKARPPIEHRLIVRNGDVVVLEGDAQVQIIRRRPAFVRMIAEPNREYLVVLVEYLSAAGQIPMRRTDRATVYSTPEGAWQWPLPARWEGMAWLEESGDSPADRSSLMAIETADGTVAFSRSPAARAKMNTVSEVRFRSSQTAVSTERPPFDTAERDALVTALRVAAQPLVRR